MAFYIRKLNSLNALNQERAALQEKQRQLAEEFENNQNTESAQSATNPLFSNLLQAVNTLGLGTTIPKFIIQYFNKKIIAKSQKKILLPLAKDIIFSSIKWKLLVWSSTKMYRYMIHKKH